MKVINTVQELKEFIRPVKQDGRKIALVPTMGALHKGHLSLIDKAVSESDFVVGSIFVNPTQFTDPKDLEKYPRPLEHDISMLAQSGCDVVFTPSVKEMYPGWPAPEDWHIDLGAAEFLLEGTFRKGHYQGVTQIVKKLFDAVEPDIAFFGQKDFQQVLMIRKMVDHFNLPVRIVSCPIIREQDGLAMSSRNIHLSAAEHQKALILSKTLNYVKEHYTTLSISELTANAEKMIRNEEGVVLDYFTIADGKTLLPVKEGEEGMQVALIAAKVGQTRLIDNIILAS